MRIVRSQAARSDLIEHFLHLAEQASEKTAERFLDRFDASLQVLAAQALAGAPVPTTVPELRGIRKWAVSDFERFLIFYLPGPSELLVGRVLYSSRDWWTLLGLDD